jgi:3D (Asp-Asp-Asp) domain-containing protein
LFTTRGWLRAASGSLVLLLLVAGVSQGTWLGSVEGNADAQQEEKKDERQEEKKDEKKEVKRAWVLIIAEGKKQGMYTEAGTVQELLDAQGIYLNEFDRVTPPLSSPIRHHTRIRITRVRVETKTQQTSLPYQTEYRFSPALRPGESKVIQEGENGISERETKIWYRDGQDYKRERGGTKVTKPPVNRVVIVGSSSALASRGDVRVRKVLELVATAYSPDPRDNGYGNKGLTSTGLRVGYGIVAIDPRVIPYGTRLYVEGYGFAVAADCGSAIKGYRIDLAYDSYERAKMYGRKKVKVFILE